MSRKNMHGKVGVKFKAGWTTAKNNNMLRNVVTELIVNEKVEVTLATANMLIKKKQRQHYKNYLQRLLKEIKIVTVVIQELLKLVTVVVTMLKWQLLNYYNYKKGIQTNAFFSYTQNFNKI